MQPQTTFIGRNPFLPPKPKGITMTTKKSIPAKKAKITQKNEDYSTPYAPPPPPVALLTSPNHIGDGTQKVNQAALPDYLIDMGVSITCDPLPAGRIMAPGSRKYDPLFERLAYGQSVKVPTKHVGKIANALRKFLEIQKKTGMVRTVNTYPADGMGRVWLLEKVALHDEERPSQPYKTIANNAYETRARGQND